MPFTGRHRFYFLLSLLLAGGWVWLFLNLYTAHSLSVCLFKKCTGLPCPSCGSTRAAMLFFRGDFSTALLVNPLGILIPVLAVVVTAWLAVDVLRKSSSLSETYFRSERYLKKHPAALIVLLSFVSINWIWNICKGL